MAGFPVIHSRQHSKIKQQKIPTHVHKHAHVYAHRNKDVCFVQVEITPPLRITKANESDLSTAGRN